MSQRKFRLELRRICVDPPVALTSVQLLSAFFHPISDEKQRREESTFSPAKRLCLLNKDPVRRGASDRAGR